MQYKIKQNDGKLHTRFSDLLRATPKQVERIIKERMKEQKPFESDTLEFGKLRHEMWEKETKETKRIPQCFIDAFPQYDVEVTHAEEEFATEIFKDIVLHSRPDAVAAKDAIVFDYKTQKRGRGGASVYKNSKQLPTYSWQLANHNIRIKKIVYLVEIWNVDEEGEMVDVYDYDFFEKEIKFTDIHDITTWIKPRCEVLAEGMRISGIWTGASR